MVQDNFAPASPRKADRTKSPTLSRTQLGHSTSEVSSKVKSGTTSSSPISSQTLSRDQRRERASGHSSVDQATEQSTPDKLSRVCPTSSMGKLDNSPVQARTTPNYAFPRTGSVTHLSSIDQDEPPDLSGYTPELSLTFTPLREVDGYQDTPDTGPVTPCRVGESKVKLGPSPFRSVAAQLRSGFAQTLTLGFES